jgi:hypothetical protein
VVQLTDDLYERVTALRLALRQMTIALKDADPAVRR